MRESIDLSGKVAFITGGNRGVGLETARGLGRRGAAVVIGARNDVRGEEAARQLRSEGISAGSIACDVTRQENHRAAYQYFERRHGKLDILINNAGVLKEAEDATAFKDNQTSTVSLDVLRETFETNFFAAVQLTQTLLPLIRKSTAGRIVNVSSAAGSLTIQADPDASLYGFKMFTYNASKTALNAFTIHLAHELRDTPIKVNSAHPGWVKTNMGGVGGELDVEQGALSSIRLATLPADGPTGGFFHIDQPLPW